MTAAPARRWCRRWPALPSPARRLSDQPTGRLALVFELMEMNIYELIRGRRQPLSEERVKMFMYQLLKSVDHMHRCAAAASGEQGGTAA